MYTPKNVAVLNFSAKQQSSYHFLGREIKAFGTAKRIQLLHRQLGNHVYYQELVAINHQPVAPELFEAHGLLTQVQNPWHHRQVSIDRLYILCHSTTIDGKDYFLQKSHEGKGCFAISPELLVKHIDKFFQFNENAEIILHVCEAGKSDLAKSFAQALFKQPHPLSYPRISNAKLFAAHETVLSNYLPSSIYYFFCRNEKDEPCFDIKVIDINQQGIKEENRQQDKELLRARILLAHNFAIHPDVAMTAIKGGGKLALQRISQAGFPLDSHLIPYVNGGILNRKGVALLQDDLYIEAKQPFCC